MLERTFDAEFFNRIANLPEVRPGLAPESMGKLDLGPVVTNPANYALRTEHGGFILVAHGAGFYSVHTQFAAEGRGAHAVEAMRAGLDFMFTRTDCMQIDSLCPDSNRPALQLALKGGAKPWFKKAHDSLYGPGMVVRWEVLDWLTSGAAQEDGETFHELLESAKMHADSPLPTHADDPAHNSAVGATIRMCKRGQPRKGVALYNLWATAAGYTPISLVSDDPPVVDVVDAVIGLKGDELEVLLCR